MQQTFTLGSRLRRLIDERLTQDTLQSGILVNVGVIELWEGEGLQPLCE